MSIGTISAAVLAAADSNALPVPSVIFPAIALGAFALIGAVTWSYRDVAHRHATRAGGSGSSDAPHGPGH